MNLKFTKIRKSFCIFFVGLLLVSMNMIPTLAEEYSPDSEIYSHGKEQEVNGTRIACTYGFYRKKWDAKTNVAEYTVGSYYDFYGDAELHSDTLIVNGKEVGTFKSNNGKHSAGTVVRTERLTAYLHSGWNTLITSNVAGVGGDSSRKIFIRAFATPPVVTMSNGIWNEGDVARGIRTWESLYTDGAAGSSEANKTQTTTGFMFKDVDEQPTEVNAYSATIIGQNSYINSIKNASTGATTSFASMTNPGVYEIEACTKDMGGLRGCGKRLITVNKNDPPIIIATDKTFYEGQYTQDEWLHAIRWSDVTASDSEDGNMFSKVKIIYDNVDVNTPNTYKVMYYVSDSGGKIATKEIQVIVKYNNPPTIRAEDRWFYVETNITNDMLLERVTATDVEDGTISSKATITSSNVQNGVLGTYDVIYQIKDVFGKRAETHAKIHIIPNTMKEGDEIRYLRFIHADYMNTLKDNSIWKKEGYETLLVNAVEKTQDEQAVEIWHITSEELEKMKKFDETHDYTKENAQAFYENFKHVIE